MIGSACTRFIASFYLGMHTYTVNMFAFRFSVHLIRCRHVIFAPRPETATVTGTPLQRETAQAASACHAQATSQACSRSRNHSQ